MLYLLATIFLNTVLSVILKFFPKYKIDALQAIVANYWVCVITGSLSIGYFPVGQGSVTQPWFPWSLMMGAGFICVFNLFAYNTSKEGITTATIANKLSLVIPVVFSVWLYNDHIGLWKIVGILLAFPAVYLTSRVHESEKKSHHFIWPVLLFLGSGLLDTLVTYVQKSYLPTPQLQAVYTIHIFAFAGTIGTILTALLISLGKIQFNRRNILAGILVGVPNYFSIYYLIRMLNSNFLQSSASIPINNIGILVTSALVAILFFKEKINLQRFIGLILAVGAILLIAFGDKNGSI